MKKSAGVVVTDVEGGSPAESVGLSSGDVITSVGGKRVRTAGEYRDAMKEQSPSKGVRMQVSRDGVTRFVFLRASR